ncbi:MAG: DUF711 family protein [Desulfurococcales archaeon]|nr:DUF711 family protein [Desulfurococcales archaeon]
MGQARFSVRSLTLHVDKRGLEESGWGYVEDLATKLAEAKDMVLSEGFEVFSARLTLPDGSASLLEEASSAVDRLAEERIIVSIGYVSLKAGAGEEVVMEAASNGLYLAVPLEAPDWDSARRVSRLVHALAEEDPVYATKVGVNVLGRPLTTPYYPLSWSQGDELGLSISLTYPSYLAEAYRKEGLPGIEKALRTAASAATRLGEKASKLLGARFEGVDLSVAPWMEDSSLGLAETVAGVRMPSPGFAIGVSLVNQAIRRVSREFRTVGFNEVQLPVGEDLKLKARVSEGDVRARDLARLAGACVAGLDLAVVPYSIDGVAGLILETAAYSMAKDRPLGVRIVPVEGVEPGDKVRLGMFGDTPVIGI